MLSMILLLSVSASPAAEEDKDTLVKVGGTVPAFALQSLDGKTLTSDSLKGKVVLINFFATWCWPCMIEMPQLQRQVYERYKDNPAFVMVSVGYEHTAPELEEFLKDHNFAFPIAPDPKGEAYALFAKKSIPRNYLIGPDGKILYQSVGFGDAEFHTMVMAIDKAVKKIKKP